MGFSMVPQRAQCSATSPQIGTGCDIPSQSPSRNPSCVLKRTESERHGSPCTWRVRRKDLLETLRDAAKPKKTKDSEGDCKRAGLDNVPGSFIRARAGGRHLVHHPHFPKVHRSGDVRACHQACSTDWGSICPT